MNRIAALATLLLIVAFAAAPAQAADREISLPRSPLGATLEDDFIEMSGDGSVLFLETEAVLSPADGDTSFDVYALKDGVATLLSDRVQPGPDSADDASVGGSSADGSRAFVVTREPLTSDDGDTAQDVYEWTASGTTLLTDRVQTGTDTNLPARVKSVAKDGSRMIFNTEEKLVDADGDSESDLYLRAGSETKLLTDRVQPGADA